MKKSNWLAVLMAIAILGVVGFQVYWLKQNYAREKNSLVLKTNTAFHETVVRLQAFKLKGRGGGFISNTTNPSIKLVMRNAEDSLDEDIIPSQDAISKINIIRDNIRDTGNSSQKVVISMQKSSSFHIRSGDSLQTISTGRTNIGDSSVLINLLYGVDSLQEKIGLQEIDSAFAIRLEKEKINIPFTVTIADTIRRFLPLNKNQVRVGFKNPIVYELNLVKPVGYLLKQIRLPILFSILLTAVIVAAFVLLYKNMRRQERLADLKNEFISNITHELKTPIATVGVAIEALRNFNAMDNPNRAKEYLDISGNELHRLSLLVDKVLKLSMFEKKEVELRYEEIDLHSLVQEVVNSLRLQIEKFGAVVNVSTTGNVIVSGDRLHLLSVIFNLVDNALKYRKENPVIDITISEEKDTVALSIKDNGIGIPPEYKEKVFEKFFRVPHGDTHNAKGYGLGLSYVAQIVKKHHGKVIVETEPGTSFIITLPKTPSHA